MTYIIKNCLKNTLTFLKLNSGEESVTWKGRYRCARQKFLYFSRKHSAMVRCFGDSGKRRTVGRAGAGLALAVLSGDPVSSKPLVDKYREAASKAGHPPENVKVAVTGHMFISKRMNRQYKNFTRIIQITGLMFIHITGSMSL